ncbi:hypothetical protein Pint_11849 [Pistacia integerrima]|uniref:Uncharacterized protein n=1 Tax=Pistacia integerrima TaxID=434235 RepID=A0ACC0XK03_9ROSI|nr:hypothetical protein Pint_11849 [Pistacia integerrima]
MAGQNQLIHRAPLELNSQDFRGTLSLIQLNIEHWWVLYNILHLPGLISHIV